MASYQVPGVTNPVYDVSQSIEVKIVKGPCIEEAQEENPSQKHEDEESTSPERERSKSTLSMLDILIVARDKATDTNSIYQEKEAILIDDGRKPCNDDTIIDLNIDSEALRFVSVFLLITLQRIPRHYSDRMKAILSVCQVFIVIGMFAALANDMGIFSMKTLTVYEFANPITTVKNVICNLRYPLLYIIGIFYFRTRHLENMLSNIRLTKRYWKYGRKMLIIMVITVLCLTVLIPTISNTTQMSFPNRSNPDEVYEELQIIISCIVTLFVRLMSLSVVFAFILVVYLIYCQVRMFKEQIQNWPLDCSGFARNFYNDVCRLVRNAERAFQPFLIVHFVIFLALLIPLVISYVEQYETRGQYYTFVTTSKSIPLKDPIIIVDKPSQSSIAQKLFNNENQETSRNNTKLPVDNVKTTKELHPDFQGIAQICLMFLADFFDFVALFGLPVLLIGKVDKCIKAIKDAIRMLNFNQQIENHYMFQSEKEIAVWDSILSDARGMQLMGFNLASFKGALITLLFPFVTVVLRFLLRRVNINP